MADRIIERTETEAPRESVVVHEDRRDRSSNLGIIIALIVLVIILLFLFGGRIFGGSGSDDSSPINNTKIENSNPTESQ